MRSGSGLGAGATGAWGLDKSKDGRWVRDLTVHVDVADAERPLAEIRSVPLLEERALKRFARFHLVWL